MIGRVINTVTLVLALVFLTACKDKEKCSVDAAVTNPLEPDRKAILLTKMAEIPISRITDSLAIDTALSLLNEANRLDSNYFTAFYNKQIYLLFDRQYDAMLANVRHLHKLRPNQPLWLSQEALLLEFMGDSLRAKEIILRALDQYECLLRIEEDLNLELHLGYLGAMVIHGREKEAQAKFEEYKATHPDWPFWDKYPFYSKQQQLEMLEKPMIILNGH
jgi:tetratricopeptide (TPR) repeat protein